MSTKRAAKQKQVVNSSALSADAAEFYPQNASSQQPNLLDAASLLPVVALGEDKQAAAIMEMPKYLTSCYPFVPPGDLRQHFIRFPQQCTFAGAVAPPLSIPVAPSVQLATWQAVKPGFVGHLQQSQLTSVPLDALATVPLDIPGYPRVPGDGLVAAPSLGVHPQRQGLVLAANDPASWYMSLASPLLFQQACDQQNLPPYHQLPHSSVAAAADLSLQSSAQTSKKAPHTSSKAETTHVKGESEQKKAAQSPTVNSSLADTDKEESDSGYNSPLHKQNLVLTGTQTTPLKSSPCPSNLIETTSTYKAANPMMVKKKDVSNSAGTKFRKEQIGITALNIQPPKLGSQSPLPGSNSPHFSKATTHLNAHNSKCPGDLQKINVHSWSEFPPMSASLPPSTQVVGSAVHVGKRVPLKVERSAHEPPWSLRFSSTDHVKSERGQSVYRGTSNLAASRNDSSINSHLPSSSSSTSPKSSALIKSAVDVNHTLVSSVSHPADGLQTSGTQDIRFQNTLFMPPPFSGQESSKSCACDKSSKPNLSCSCNKKCQSQDLHGMKMGHVAAVSIPGSNNVATSQCLTSSPLLAYPTNISTPDAARQRLGPASQSLNLITSNEQNLHEVKKDILYTGMPSSSGNINASTGCSSFNGSNSVYRKEALGSDHFSLHTLTADPQTQAHLITEHFSCQGGEEKKRRRRRKRSRGHRHTEDNENGELSDKSPSVGNTVCNDTESLLHFEDTDEFPDLSSSEAHGCGKSKLETQDGSRIPPTLATYSDILKLKNQRPGETQAMSRAGVPLDADNISQDGKINESKKARKRRKRREQANKAAEAELAEITLEQQWLKEVGIKKSPNNNRPTPGLIANAQVVSESKKGPSEKKSKQPIAFDIAAMIDAIQKKPAASVPPTPSSTRKSKVEHGLSGNAAFKIPGNMLDSSAPQLKRGKEKELGKSKKPSPLKKVILKEREQKKRLKLLNEDTDTTLGLGNVSTSAGVGVVGGESELSQDALSIKSGEIESDDKYGVGELSADFSPISQTSPISMSPASPGNSGVNSPITGSVGRDAVTMKIHSRRFREYCTQILDKEIDQCCTSLLQDLIKFQDRMYHKDPVKAKMKRRVVLGLREVTKHLKLKKIKCVVISPNLEKIQSKGGLDEALNNILNMCREQEVPFVFALGRRALGRACAKLVPVSVVGIFNYEGCESKYRSLISLTEAARTAYNEMVLAVEKEVAEYSALISETSSLSGVPGLYAAHMGHSRTPSGCSAISFTSSVLSEPISENYPHAEPEVDSKGYEIISNQADRALQVLKGAVNTKAGLTTDIDDGNEADTEEACEIRKKRNRDRPVNSVRFRMTGDGNEGKGGFGVNTYKGGMAVEEVEDGSNEGKLSRNVSELTLTGEDSFLKNDQCLVPSSLEDKVNSDPSFNERISSPGTEVNPLHDENLGSKWVSVGHIDSIHSQDYSLGDEILSHHSAQSFSCDIITGIKGGARLSHAAVSVTSEPEQQLQLVEQTAGLSVQDAEENRSDAENIEEQEDSAQRHRRIIDKERIKNWLESQTLSAND